MKFLSHFVALYLPTVNSVNVVPAIASALILSKVWAGRVLGKIAWKPSPKRNPLEKDIWAIE